MNFCKSTDDATTGESVQVVMRVTTADLAELTPLYLSPCWCSSVRKSIMPCTDACSGCICCLSQYLNHLAQYERYCVRVLLRHALRIIWVADSDSPVSVRYFLIWEMLSNGVCAVEGVICPAPEVVSAGPASMVVVVVLL